MEIRLEDARARITSGMVEGDVLSNGIKRFRGIPYAAAPVRELRWKYPVAPVPWVGIKKTNEWGAECAQLVYGDETSDQVAIKSEDGLFLNIWTPAQSNDERLPVLFWIHGGGYTGGSSSQGLYEGETLAQKGVVVVTINYRMGIFGFFAHPELTAESPYHASGNFGLADQIFALQWTRDNIAAFGGDPDRITIAGSSAGAGSVFSLVASPLTKGLCAGAICQSGAPYSKVFENLSLAQAEEDGIRFARELGAESLAELREVPMRKFIEYDFSPLGNKPPIIRTAPIVDGYILPEDVGVAFDNGWVNDIPMLVGSNADEFAAAFQPGDTMSLETLRSQAEAELGKAAEKVLACYPVGNEKDTVQARIKITADSFLASAIRVAGMKDQHGQKPAYVYYFSHPIPHEDSAFYGAPHSCELPYLFGHVDWGKVNPWDQRKWVKWDFDMQELIQGYWTNFVKTGDPNGEGLPQWKPYQKAADELLEIGEEVTMVQNPRREQLEAFSVYE